MTTPHYGEHGQMNTESAPVHQKCDPPADQTFGQRLAQVGLPDVYYVPKRFPGQLHINLGNLHRMMLHSLQREFVEEVSKIRQAKTVSQDQTKTIRAALSSYGE